MNLKNIYLAFQTILLILIIIVSFVPIRLISKKKAAIIIDFLSFLLSWDKESLLLARNFQIEHLSLFLAKDKKEIIKASFTPLPHDPIKKIPELKKRKLLQTAYLKSEKNLEKHTNFKKIVNRFNYE